MTPIRAAWKRLRGGGPTSRIARKLMAAHRSGEVAELSRAEMKFLFDRATRRKLGMPLDEFLRRLERGDLPDSPLVDQLAFLAGGPRTS